MFFRLIRQKLQKTPKDNCFLNVILLYFRSVIQIIHVMFKKLSIITKFNYQMRTKILGFYEPHFRVLGIDKGLMMFYFCSVIKNCKI